MLVVWTTFLLLGRVIAERAGLSGSWVGLILMATVTSLPELVTGVSSIRVAGSPDWRSATRSAAASSTCSR